MPQRRNSIKSQRCSTNMPNLQELSRLPSNRHVLHRRRTLQNENMGRPKSKFLSVLAKEIAQTWTQQDIPVQDWTVIYNKILKQPIPNNNELFDCLSHKPQWKSQEDKQYYFNQKNGVGGYCTSKLVPSQVHPSKLSKFHQMTLQSTENFSAVIDENSDSEEADNQDDSSDTSSFREARREPGFVSFAEELKTAANLSIGQTIAVMNFYKKKFPDLEDIPNAPTSGGLSKSSRKRDAIISKEITSVEEKQILYFDMKKYKKLYGMTREVICVCVNDKLVEFQQIPNKKSVTISSVLVSIISKFNIQIIVSDTEPTITGSKAGVIKLIKNNFPQINYEPCRLHLLDLVLRYQVAYYLGDVPSTSPDIPYDFVRYICDNWKEVTESYSASHTLQPSFFDDLPVNESRRDDYRYLLELTKAIRTFRQSGEKPSIRIPKSSVNISNARWNSMAIYCLMAELFLIDENQDLISLNTFIVSDWAPVWFGVRGITDWSKLENLCEKAKNILMKHGLLNKVEHSPPSNEFAERIFRLSYEKIPRCKSMLTLRNSLIRYVNNGEYLCEH